MKKLFIAGAVLLLLGTASLSEARIGIGYDGYNSALSLKYMGAKFGIQGMVRFDMEGEPSGGTGVSQMLTDVTLKFLFPMFQDEKIHLNGVVGIGMQDYSGLGHVKDVTKMNTGWLLGFSPEYFVLPNLSFETSFGVGGTMFGATKVSGTAAKDDYTSISTFGQQMSISTSLAFHYYFAEKEKAAK